VTQEAASSTRHHCRPSAQLPCLTYGLALLPAALKYALTSPLLLLLRRCHPAAAAAAAAAAVLEEWPPQWLAAAQVATLV
jgi:hypothetical protein